MAKKKQKMNDKIVIRNVEELIEAEYNPRELTEDQAKHLTDSLKRFGFVDPVLVNINKDRKDIIIGGHQRTKIAKQLGYTEVPCVEMDLTYDQEKELNIRLNKNTGQFDMDMLANHFEMDDLVDWGFQPEELNVFDDVVELEAEEDDFEVPDEVHTDIVQGDLIEIGEHRLLCGSSTETDNWQKIMGEELCDLVVTDPPYNVAYEGKTKDALTIENDSMADDDFYQFLYDFYTALGSYTKAGGSWYVWHADSEGANFRTAMKDAGIMVKQCLIWVKQTMVMGRQDYHWKHEPCLYGWKEGAAHNWYADRKQTTVLEFDRPFRNAEHPTMKPIPLIAYQIQNSSKKGDLVCDAFLGSGTTMVASHETGRKCYGMELDPKYCQVIVDRMMKLDDSLEVKINGKKYVKKDE